MLQSKSKNIFHFIVIFDCNTNEISKFIKYNDLFLRDIRYNYIYLNFLWQIIKVIIFYYIKILEIFLRRNKHLFCLI